MLLSHTKPTHVLRRGNGTAFVFRLSGDTSACYRWEPMQGSDRQDGTLSAAHAQFALCATDYIIVGGSAFHGTNALRIDSELKTCYSGPSDTYGNPPLAPEERIQPFVIGTNQIRNVVFSAPVYSLYT